MKGHEKVEMSHFILGLKFALSAIEVSAESHLDHDESVMGLRLITILLSVANCYDLDIMEEVQKFLREKSAKWEKKANKRVPIEKAKKIVEMVIDMCNP